MMPAPDEPEVTGEPPECYCESESCCSDCTYESCSCGEESCCEICCDECSHGSCEECCDDCCSESSSECSTCQGSPSPASSDKERNPEYAQDLNVIKDFIADIAKLVKQGKLTPPKEEPEVAPETKEDVRVQVEQEQGQKPQQTAVLPTEQPLDPPELEVTARYTSPDETEVATNTDSDQPAEVVDTSLDREIAHIEEIITASENSLRNSYSHGEIESLDQEGDVSPVESQYSNGASTVFGSDIYDCNPNDHTMTNAISEMPTPVSMGRSSWHSGFDFSSPVFCEDGHLENEEELDALHARMVSLDLRSYMYLIEKVLDERVRRELDSGN